MPLGKSILCLNNNFNDKNNKNEFVIFLGSSRFKSAIHTDTLTEKFHNKNVSFIDLSMATAGPWNYLKVLENLK